VIWLLELLSFQRYLAFLQCQKSLFKHSGAPLENILHQNSALISRQLQSYGVIKLL